MASESHFDLIIIGGGPGGYVAAIRAAQLGRKVACIELEPQLGGTCLRVGCIPSKALLESSELFEQSKKTFAGRGIVASNVELNLGAMMTHKEGVVKALTGGIDGLFKKRKITRILGRARLDGPGRVAVETKTGAQSYTAEFIIIATGSVPSTLPGIELDGDKVVSSTEALSFSKVPPRLVVIGAGYIGLELGTVWRRLGSEVVVLEFLDRILPGMDSELAAEGLKLFKKQGLEFRLGCKVTGVTVGKACEVAIEGDDPVRCDRVLVSVGRKPNSQNLGLETVGVQTDKRGFITVDKEFRTSAPGVYAIGDVIGGAMLAHKAEEEGVACVEQIVTGRGHVNYDAIPGVVYTEPEIATVGKTEDSLKESGVPYKKGAFPFIANGRARASGHTEGFVKILAHAETDRILGIHIIGAHAGELIAEAVAALEFGATSEDLARTCHAHPTLAECIKEAALGVMGRSIHI
jgi:dihydrolipoamide dehydrogenase